MVGRSREGVATDEVHAIFPFVAHRYDTASCTRRISRLIFAGRSHRRPVARISLLGHRRLLGIDRQRTEKICMGDVFLAATRKARYKSWRRTSRRMENGENSLDFCGQSRARLKTAGKSVGLETNSSNIRQLSVSTLA